MADEQPNLAQAVVDVFGLLRAGEIVRSDLDGLRDSEDDEGELMSQLARSARMLWLAARRCAGHAGVELDERDDLIDEQRGREVIDELARRAFLRGADAACELAGVADRSKVLAILGSITGDEARRRTESADLVVELVLPRMKGLVEKIAEAFATDVEFYLDHQKTDSDRVHAVRGYFRTDLAVQRAAAAAGEFFQGAAQAKNDAS